MTVLLSHRMLLAGWARRATPTAAQWIHHNPEKMTLLEMLGTTNLRKSTPKDYRILREIFLLVPDYHLMSLH